MSLIRCDSVESVSCKDAELSCRIDSGRGRAITIPPSFCWRDRFFSKDRKNSQGTCGASGLSALAVVLVDRYLLGTSIMHALRVTHQSQLSDGSKCSGFDDDKFFCNT